MSSNHISEAITSGYEKIHPAILSDSLDDLEKIRLHYLENEARKTKGLKKLNWDGGFYRKDIGFKVIK